MRRATPSGPTSSRARNRRLRLAAKPAVDAERAQGSEGNVLELIFCQLGLVDVVECWEHLCDCCEAQGMKDAARELKKIFPLFAIQEVENE